MTTCCQRHTTMAERSEQIVELLTDSLIYHGKEILSLREISEGIDCSPSQASHAAYHTFDMDHGWKRITPVDAFVDVHERNFNTVTHQRKCQGYRVTRDHLASIIRALKEEKS